MRSHIYKQTDMHVHAQLTQKYTQQTYNPTVPHTNRHTCIRNYTYARTNYLNFASIRALTFRQSRDMSAMMERGANSKINSREKKLLETILIVLIVFILSWGPYCLMLVLDTLGIVDVSSNENCMFIFFFNFAFLDLFRGVRVYT